MKMTLLLCALLLSVYGWCSSGPARYTAAARTVSNYAARTVSHAAKTVSNAAKTILPEDHSINNGGVGTLVLWGAVLYIGVLLWWTRSAKRRLDKTLEGVMESMGQY